MRLSEFRVDTHALNDGIWIRVSEATYGDLEILSRGFTDEFIDAQGATLTRAAERYGGERTRIPNSDMRILNADLLRRYLVIDVRNLTDDNGEPVSIAEFHQMLSDQAYGRLARACWEAAGRVSTQSLSQLDAASGNSARPSRPNSNGANSTPV